MGMASWTGVIALNQYSNFKLCGIWASCWEQLRNLTSNATLGITWVVWSIGEDDNKYNLMVKQDSACQAVHIDSF